MADDDFQALLSKPLSDTAFDRPPPLPEGSYVAQFGEYSFGKANNEKKTPFVSYKVKLVEALPDVNADELLALTKVKPLHDFDLKQDFYLTGDAAWRLGEFLKDHVKVDEGLTGAEAIQQAVGRQCVVALKKQENRKKPGEFFVNIDQTAAMPE